MIKKLLATALVTTLAAVAAPATAHGQASHRTRATLTNADDGRSLIAHPGDDVQIRLTGVRESGLTYSWSVPQSSDSAVVRRTNGSTTPSGDATAAFRAEHDGAVTITATRRCHADPGHVCPSVVTPWKVTVSVK